MAPEVSVRCRTMRRAAPLYAITALLRKVGRKSRNPVLAQFRSHDWLVSARIAELRGRGFASLERKEIDPLGVDVTDPGRFGRAARLHIIDGCTE